MSNSDSDLLDQRVKLAQPLAHARPTSSLRPTTRLALEVPDLGIQPTSKDTPNEFANLHNSTNQLTRPVSNTHPTCKQRCKIIQKLL